MTRAFLLSLIVCLWWCISRAIAADAPPLEAGVGLHGPLTWGHTDAAHARYLTPVYAGAEYALPLPLLREVKASGFDFIRLSVDPGPLIALEEAEREALEAQVADAVKN